MIEDALKSTRNLHRLILGVSLVTLVFSMSLRIADEQREQKAAIDALIEIDFLAYETWLQAKLEAEIDRRLPPAVLPVREFLETGGYLVFNLEDLAEALEAPAHIGKLLTEELVLGNVSGATLSQLNALNGLSLSKNVQITVPHVEPLVAEFAAFLEDKPGAGKRLTNVSAAINSFDFTAESFLPGDTVTAALYFELVDAVVVGSAPVFQANFDADIVSLPDTSFVAWLEEANISPVIEVNDGQVTFAPSLADAPPGFHQEKLGTLSLRLADEIKAAGPEERTATILGTQVPGLLIVLAAPLTLMALVYYFVSHTSHIARLADRRAAEMVGFAWLPITMTVWWIRGTMISVRGHAVELFASLAFLPISALAVMYWRLLDFGGVSVLTTLLVALAAVWIGVFWWFGLCEIDRIRGAIRSAEIGEAKPDATDLSGVT